MFPRRERERLVGCLPILRCATNGERRDRAEYHQRRTNQQWTGQKQQKKPRCALGNFRRRDLPQRGKAFKLEAWKHVLLGVYGANRGGERVVQFVCILFTPCLQRPRMAWSMDT